MFIAIEKKKVIDKTYEDKTTFTVSDINGSADEYANRIVWWDLHLSSKAYRNPGANGKSPWKGFRKNKKKGKQFIVLEPNQTLIIETSEKIRTGTKTLGIILGSASVTGNGLQVTSGKIDPNFGLAPIALGVQNVSDEALSLYEGQKIATVAFCKIDLPTTSLRAKGHASPDDAYDLGRWALVESKVSNFIRKNKKKALLLFIFYIFVVYTDSIALKYINGMLSNIKAVYSDLAPNLIQSNKSKE